MSYSTACHILRKRITFSLIQRLGLDDCFRCGNKIKTAKELSNDHKIDWLDVDPDLLWDIGNIAFSHWSCNSRHHRTKDKIRRPEGFEYCGDCESLKPLDEFWRNQGLCKSCKNSRNNEWRYKTGRRKRPKIKGRTDKGESSCLENSRP